MHDEGRQLGAPIDVVVILAPAIQLDRDSSHVDFFAHQEGGEDDDIHIDFATVYSLTRTFCNTGIYLHLNLK